MFREMRRKNQALTLGECEEILREGSSGVLALSGDEGYPYALPISYVYENGKIYFHCAKTGHKIDAIGRNPKASFCVVAMDEVMPEKYTTKYKSVIAFGHMRILNEPEDIISSIRKLGIKYAPENSEEQLNEEISKDLARLCMLEMRIENISGKQGRELL
ncbi:MAG: pyridoxamine 5'-phosphate oxidase family protein [Clostridiales bacterium]|nr:pyridoxamine 5'-phosphate oxidase family protein [Clostridiales bacterium]